MAYNNYYGYEFPNPGQNVFNPPLPYCGQIEGGVYDGVVVKISGTVNSGADAFGFNIMTDPGEENIAFHFNPRFSESAVVMNSKIDGDWGEEERSEEFPFQHGRDFDMDIYFKEKGYKVKIDGKTKIKFASRYDMYAASYLAVFGDVTIRTIRYGSGQEVAKPPPPPVIEAPSFTQPNFSNRGTVINPVVPFNGPIYGGIEPGKLIFVQGYVRPDANKFTINLQSLEGDIGVHFDVRFDSRTVVRNSMLGGDWGGEEDDGQFRFQKGAPFEIIYLIQDDRYRIAVNGQHFTDFFYRGDRNESNRIDISGDVIIGSIRVSGGDSLYNHEVPNEYTEGIPGGLREGKLVYISGIPNPHPNRFYMNIQCGDTPDCNIAFHFNPRFEEQEVVRNTKIYGDWPQEERDQPYFPFHPNHPFTMCIQCTPGEFQVFVNGDHFCNYSHRLDDFDCMDTVKVGGDVEITHIRVI